MFLDHSISRIREFVSPRDFHGDDIIFRDIALHKFVNTALNERIDDLLIPLGVNDAYAGVFELIGVSEQAVLWARDSLREREQTRKV